jgi:hypothetical protein
MTVVHWVGAVIVIIIVVFGFIAWVFEQIHDYFDDTLAPCPRCDGLGIVDLYPPPEPVRSVYADSAAMNVWRKGGHNQPCPVCQGKGRLHVPDPDPLENFKKPKKTKKSKKAKQAKKAKKALKAKQALKAKK